MHSSDGRPGPIAAPMPSGRLRAVTISHEHGYRVAPGLRFKRWDRTDARGTARIYLLRADLAKPGLSLQYAGLPTVASRAVLTDILAADGAVAGVNADFFDIDDTGAPLGVGVDEGKLLHGPASGWNSSFTVTGKAGATIGTVPVHAAVEGHPAVHVVRVNSPHVPPGGIGVYTSRWGTSPGYHVADGARKRDVRQVLIRRGRVVSNTRDVTRGATITGRLLIGRGAGAVDLSRRLPVGARARVRVGVDGAPRVVVSGSQALVADGKLLSLDDSELHPRTAVGIDTDTGRVLLVVVDGRQESSSGYTLRQLGMLMVSLGAEDALNLDGGGSSTMVTKRPSGAVRVANSPSDGDQRPVPEGIELVYTPPAG
ncbi:MAG: hypothetical protein QOK15_2275 [Nocardioidaceae bacterium]|nr:hypothetical protein [Nocardioidaceae bacterium]